MKKPEMDAKYYYLYSMYWANKMKIDWKMARQKMSNESVFAM